MDERTFSTLELGSLLDLLGRHAQTELGRRKIMALRPASDPAVVRLGQEFTTECAEFLKSGERFGLSGLEDPAPALAQLHIEGTSLTSLQILLLERILTVGAGLRDAFRGSERSGSYPRLATLTSQIPDLRTLLGGIRGKILPGGEIDDHASPALRMLRREINESRVRIHRTLDSILQGQARAVQDEIITFRNGRFVIPVRTDSRGLVPGVVHGLSSSGQTTFVEPMSVIDQNNDLVRLREEEEAEIARILFSMTESLREHADVVDTVVLVVAEVDFAQAKAWLSAEFACVAPRLSSDRRLRLVDARHMMLEHGLRTRGGQIVPISVDLDETNRVLVVSGPNAGGKTVVVKTVGLISLMAQMGLHVPAREAMLPVFGQILADIGDQQSIAANLSTFTAHMKNIAGMSERVTSKGLILLDEVGTGTDPDEGAALAVAIIDFFLRAGAITIATTHYPGLKIWASQTAGVINGSVEFDEQTLRPTYRLILGIAGSSSGIEIARRMSIPAQILDHARTLIEPGQIQAREYLAQLKAALDEHEARLHAIDLQKSALLQERTRMEREFAEREAARVEEFEEALSRALREFSVESDRMIQSIKNRIERERLKSAAAGRAAELRRIGERLHQESRRPEGGRGRNAGGQPGAPARLGSEIREGDRVRVIPFGKEGIVESVRDETYSVAVGALKFRASRSDLQLVASAAPAKQESIVAGRTPGFDPDANPASEVNVIGMNADEATARIDKFLDAVFLAGVEQVRIIHGHGKGILRRAVADLLKDHPHVDKFGTAAYDKGGAAITVVELKK
jgi:DNA mismatch repair protein MutS2